MTKRSSRFRGVTLSTGGKWRAQVCSLQPLCISITARCVAAEAARNRQLHLASSQQQGVQGNGGTPPASPNVEQPRLLSVEQRFSVAVPQTSASSI
jgi:hypothetical protein